MGVPKERSIYLQNIMTIAKIKKMSQNNVVKDKDTRYTISYIGGFSPHRGLETLMNSIPIMLEKVFATSIVSWFVSFPGMTSNRRFFAG